MLRKYFMFSFTSLTALLWLTIASLAATPLVDTDWIKANAEKDGIVFLDVRSRKAYRQGHVPYAVHTSYKRDQWRMKKGNIKGLLPPTDYLEKLIGRLGIDNSTHVVIMHGGYSAAETAVATRIYWTFKVLGHDNVSILNGGMRAWLSEKSNPLEKTDNTPKRKVFKADMNTEILASASDVRAALGTNVTLLDSRPADQFSGKSKSGSVVRYGTLPGAISVPGLLMINNDTKEFISASGLEQLYASRNAPTTGETIVFCNTGQWASLGWFIDYELLGNNQSKLYDASLAEWSLLPNSEAPMIVSKKAN